jgi:hypothetical protein
MAVDAAAVLRRVERTAVLFCVGAAAIAWLARGGRADVALGVLGGGLLVGASYLAIRGAVDGLVGLLGGPGPGPGGAAADSGAAGVEGAGASPPGPVIRAGILVRLTLRYALLGFAAYVMIARFRLHPIGLVIGASSIVVAASLEALRVVSRPAAGPRRHGR